MNWFLQLFSTRDNIRELITNYETHREQNDNIDEPDLIALLATIEGKVREIDKKVTYTLKEEENTNIPHIGLGLAFIQNDNRTSDDKYAQEWLQNEKKRLEKVKDNAKKAIVDKYKASSRLEKLKKANNIWPENI